MGQPDLSKCPWCGVGLGAPCPGEGGRMAWLCGSTQYTGSGKPWQSPACRTSELENEVERLEGENERLRKAMPKAAKHLDVHNVLRWSLRELCPETHDDAVALYGDYLLNCRAEEWNGFSPGDRAQWLLQRWLAFSQATYCSYCNAEFQADTDDAILRAHIKECPHHPLSKAYRADRLTGAMVDAAIPGCSCGSCTRLRDALAAECVDVIEGFCGKIDAAVEQAERVHLGKGGH